MTVANKFVNAATERYSFACTVKRLLSNERALSGHGLVWQIKNLVFSSRDVEN